MTPSIAAGRAGKARRSSTGKCEFAPARARREAQGSRANRMLARPSCPAPMALVTFPERKVTRAVGRRGKRHGCRIQTCDVPASSPLALRSAVALGHPCRLAGGKARSRGTRSWSQWSEQDHIELLLRVLLLGLETDGLADEGFQFGHRARVLLQDARDHARAGQHQQLLRLELAHRAGDLAENFVTDRLGGLDLAASRARRARLAQLALQALGGALASHLHQPQRTHLVD